MAYPQLPQVDPNTQGPQMIPGGGSDVAPSGSNPTPMGGPSPDASPKVVEDVEDEEDSPIAGVLEALSEDKKDFLARKVQEEFRRYAAGRFIQEQIWVRAHMNCKGVYPADMNFQEGSSRAFVQATRPKVVTAVAVIAPIILPPGDKSFTLDHTPNPYMPALAARLVGGGMTEEEVRSKIVKEADKAAANMERKVEDGLQETNFPHKVLSLALDAVQYGTGVMMGPFALDIKRKSYEKASLWDRVKSIFTGANEQVEKMGFADEYRPELENVSVFDFYPDPSARRIEDCDSAIVRKVINRSQLREWRRRKGFDAKAIDDVLQAMPDGNWTLEGSWEGIINTTNAQYEQSAPSGRFVCLLRWGWWSGRDLRKAGIEVAEDQLDEQVMAQTWVIGNKVIALMVSKLHQDRLPFYVVPYILVPHSIWGAGVPEMMFDTQDAINAYERMKMDNAAMAGGPQFVIDVSRLVQGQNLAVRPRKTWLVRKDESGSTSKPVEVFMPECRVAEYQASQDKALQFAQEQTCLPNMLMGFGGEGIHNRTAQGASMQFNSAITPLKNVIFNFENHLIVPLVQNMAKFYLEFSKDETIRGDFRVVAKGVQGLMAREAIGQKIGVFLQYAGQRQEWAAQVDMESLFKLMVKDIGLNDENVILPQAEVLRRQQAAMQQQAEMQNQQAAAQAGINMASEKMKAETTPRDALLELIREAPDGGKLQLALINQAIQAWGFGQDPNLQQAIGDDQELLHFGQMATAHAHGYGDYPDPKPTQQVDPAELQRNQEKHQAELMKAQAAVMAIEAKIQHDRERMEKEFELKEKELQLQKELKEAEIKSKGEERKGMKAEKEAEKSEEKSPEKPGQPINLNIVVEAPPAGGKKVGKAVRQKDGSIVFEVSEGAGSAKKKGE